MVNTDRPNCVLVATRNLPGAFPLVEGLISSLLISNLLISSLHLFYVGCGLIKTDMGRTDESLICRCVPTNLSSRVTLNAPPSLFQSCRSLPIDTYSGTPCKTINIHSFRRLANTAPESCVHNGQQMVRLMVQGDLEK